MALVPTRPVTVARAFLASAGVQQQELAAAAGCSTTHLSEVIAGHRPASPDLRRRIADALGVAEGDLFSDSDRS